MSETEDQTTGESEEAMADTDQRPVMLQQKGIRKRMRCSGQVAHRIEETFVTAKQLVSAVESDQDLTEYSGIGPKTAETINDWWENRFSREEQMGSASVERTGTKSASIHFHSSWRPAIGENQ